ncbi:transmembrane protein 80 [Archocentrus centrarchus]|uniref:transmembrane protein 80 n=1 Tax=Archocentrus centrarchus TaxID=63155 RepID=UPI0011EA3F38|nr:transmembrane protein 80 [Archocentrus centrarchus]
MAMAGSGRPACMLSSVALQILLHVTAVYFVFYFLFTLGLIVKKSLVLSYPAEALLCDILLLFLLAALEFLHFFSGVKGNLMESETYIFGNLFLTGTIALLTIYFLVWQSYVMRADVIISTISLVLYGLDGVLAFSTLTRFASVYS